MGFLTNQESIVREWEEGVQGRISPGDLWALYDEEEGLLIDSYFRESAWTDDGTFLTNSVEYLQLRDNPFACTRTFAIQSLSEAGCDFTQPMPRPPVESEPTPPPEATKPPATPTAPPYETVTPGAPTAPPYETVTPGGPTAPPYETVTPGAPTVPPAETITPGTPTVPPDQTVAPGTPTACRHPFCRLSRHWLVPPSAAYLGPCWEPLR